jgi:CBS domain containing-hemolysin-like protein
MESSVAIGIASLFLLIAFNAFFVFAEYSLAVSRRTRIRELAEKGSRSAKIVLNVMEDPDRFFAATQVGITIMSMAIGVLSEPAFRQAFEQLIGAIPRDNIVVDGVLKIVGSVSGLLIASYFQIVLAELVPRTITLRQAERIALVVVPPMNVLAEFFRPFIWLLKNSSQFVLRLLGVKRSDAADRLHTVEELKMLVEASEKGGVIEADQSEMLSKVFSFGDTTVREVMVPRTEITSVDVAASLHDVAHVFSAHAYSRVPVFEESLDHIIGILHSKDLMRALVTGTRMPNLRQILREPFFVPDTQRADELLNQFRTRREYMAVVLDEYGGTAGLVTLSDLMARIVGEIADSSHSALPDIQRAADGTALINGMTTIGDVNDAFDLNLIDDNFDTIGGFVMSKLGRIARVGDVVTTDDHYIQFRVEEMDKLRVAKVKLKRLT